MTSTTEQVFADLGRASRVGIPRKGEKTDISDVLVWPGEALKGRVALRWCKECKAEGVARIGHRVQIAGQRRTRCEEHARRAQNGHLVGKRDEIRGWEEQARADILALFAQSDIDQADREARAKCKKLPGADIPRVQQKMLERFEEYLLDRCREAYPEPAVSVLSRESVPPDKEGNVASWKDVRKAAFRSVSAQIYAYPGGDNEAAEMPSRSITDRSIISATTPGADKARILYQTWTYRTFRPEVLAELDKKDKALLEDIEHHSAYYDKGHEDLEVPKWVYSGVKRTYAKRAASRYLRALETLRAERSERAEAAFYEKGGTPDGADIHTDTGPIVTIPVDSGISGQATRHTDGSGKSDKWEQPLPSRPQGVKGYGSLTRDEDREQNQPCKEHGYVKCDDDRKSTLKRRKWASCADPSKPTKG